MIQNLFKRHYRSTWFVPSKPLLLKMVDCTSGVWLSEAWLAQAEPVLGEPRRDQAADRPLLLSCGLSIFCLRFARVYFWERETHTWDQHISADRCIIFSCQSEVSESTWALLSGLLCRFLECRVDFFWEICRVLTSLKRSSRENDLDQFCAIGGYTSRVRDPKSQFSRDEFLWAKYFRIHLWMIIE